jgi:glycosyltransferase involved in cell wall biosynthesis
MSAVTTVSDFFKKKISENISVPTYYIIPNGYNPETIKQVEDICPEKGVLRVALAGSIYDWHPYKSVISTFAEFVKKNDYAPKIELNFFGINRHKEIEQLALENSIENNVHVYPRMDNASLLQNLSRHNVMLLFNDYSIMGTKIYDYLGLKRLILFCYSNDAEALALKDKYYPVGEVEGVSTHLQEDLINETHSGIIVKDKEHLAKVLVDLYSEFTQTGSIACNSINTSKYSRKEGVRQLAEIIKQLNI